MDVLRGASGREKAIVQVFEEAFVASEGAREGQRIGALVENLLASTPPDDLRVFSAMDGVIPIGCILFTRLVCPHSDRTIFLLAPVAVATDRQGQGIGQRLNAFRHDAIRAEGIDVAVTYGDPDFCGRVGFNPVSVETIPAPFSLSMPQGWLGQALTSQPLEALPGPTICVPEFNDPQYW